MHTESRGAGAVNEASLSGLVSVSNPLLRMKTEGFCHLDAEDFVLTDEQRRSLAAVQEHFNSLPLDTYDESANRYRQLSRYVLLPFAGLLMPRPNKALNYHQNIGFNAEAKGIERQFSALPEAVRNADFLRELIMHDFANSPLDQEMLSGPIEVGVHFIRLRATPNRPGIAVPNRLHKDGEPVTWVHLMNRRDVVGGESVITDNSQAKVLCEATLNAPLESIGLVDDMVWHMVKPVRVAESATVGIRDVILVDFTPMVAVPSKPKTQPQ
ncbi:hypothetical protein ACVIHC_004624 [Bradyrhizobium diazoefficiens]